MDTKERVTVWAAILTLAFLQLQGRVDIELNLYNSGWLGAVTAIVEYIIGFSIVYMVIRWILERYFRGKSRPPLPPPQRYVDPNAVNPTERRR